LAQNLSPATGLDGAYDDQNPFARILRGEAPRASVLETDDVIVIVPLSQASRGHLLVIPKCRCRTLADVPPSQLTAVMTTLQRLMAAERLAYNPDGFNVRQNNGADAGQTVFHVHFHLMPRYAGQPLLAEDENRLSPEAMDAAAAEVRSALARLP
jgi:histidine triad (HIT) family protein